MRVSVPLYGGTCRLSEQNSGFHFHRLAIAEIRLETPVRQGVADGLGLLGKGADEVDYQNMVYVLDVLRQLDITKVGLATEAAAAP